MNKKIKSKEGVSEKTIAGVGAGIAVLSAAAYILFGPNGKKNRKLIRGWAVKMKGEIIEKFEQAKELTEPVYHQIVDTIKAKYSKLKNVDPKELEQVVSEIKKHWNVLKKDKTKAKKGNSKKSK
jgi:gas vesicle protein